MSCELEKIEQYVAGWANKKVMLQRVKLFEIKNIRYYSLYENILYLLNDFFFKEIAKKIHYIVR